MTGFPLVLLPRRVVYVDDDGRMLDILRMTMPKKMSREFIGSPDAALKTLSQEIQYWRTLELLLGKSHHLPAELGEAHLYAGSYFTEWRRFHLTAVLIVDYQMPGLNGVELVSKLEGFPARRILLTGEADAAVAVQAFNSGVIQRFIPKNTPNLHKEITRSADDMHLSVCEQLGQLIRANLSQAQVDLLHDPAVIEGLQDKLEELDWMEYVVVARPFGLLGMSHQGPLQWLQIETREEMKDLSAALADYGYPESDVRAVARGTATPVREIRQQLGIRDDRQLIPTDVIADTPEVYCALVDLPVKGLTAREYGIDAIRTPEELMRGLLRDVNVASRRASEAGSSPEARQGLEHAVANLVSSATLSQIHAQALDATLSDSGLPSELAARVQALISIGVISGKKNGQAR